MLLFTPIPQSQASLATSSSITNHHQVASRRREPLFSPASILPKNPDIISRDNVWFIITQQTNIQQHINIRVRTSSVDRENLVAPPHKYQDADQEANPHHVACKSPYYLSSHSFSSFSYHHDASVPACIIDSVASSCIMDYTTKVAWYSSFLYEPSINYMSFKRQMHIQIETWWW